MNKGNRHTWPVRLLSSVLAGVLLAQGGAYASAEKLIDKYAILFDGEEVAYESQPDYFEVLASWKEAGYTEADSLTPDIVMEAAAYSAYGGAQPAPHSVDGKSGILFDDNTEYIEWTFEVPESGLYELKFDYYASGDSALSMQRAVLLDGEELFSQAGTIHFPRSFVDETDTFINAIGDEIAATSIEVRAWSVYTASDMNGMYSSPLLWKLDAGTHTLRLNYVDQPIVFSRLCFTPPAEVPPYEEVEAEYKRQGYRPAQGGITLQAEERRWIAGRSEGTVRSYNDGDPATVPNGTVHQRLNAMGGYSWREGNQEITYRFTVENAGLYHIALRVQQAWNTGFNSYRQIRIDGEIPFRELTEYAFPYDGNWYTKPLSDEQGNPFSFYLSEGEHTLTLSVKMSSYTAEASYRVQEVNDRISETYQKILLITSSNPDPNYEYELEKSIPGLLDTFRELVQELEEIKDLMAHVSDDRASVNNNLRMLQDTFGELAENPDAIPRRLNDITDSMTVLGNFLTDVQSSPLGLDSIELYPQGGTYTDRRSSVWSRIVGTFQNFIASFQKDYTRVGMSDTDEAVNGSIDVWISRGTEWAMILKNLIDSEFTTKYHTGVNLNILPSGSFGGTVNTMLLAITSGTAPDVVLGTTLDTPVEYAIRGVTQDLSQFEGFEEVSQRFFANSMIPFQYGGGTYALPETVNFYVMAYRKDILSSLNIPLPQTWEQVFNRVLPVLYQNNMQMAAPSFDVFLTQMGGQYYTADGTMTALDSPEAYAAFEQYIALFLDLGFPISANFYNRFRTGEMPIGIIDFTTYMQVLTAAPELAGKWDVALIPGWEQEDGTIDRSTLGLTSQSCILLSDAKNSKMGWEFLKWWTSRDVQQSFGLQAEAQIGSSARLNTANMEAFAALPWNKGHLDTILESFEWANNTPTILGGVITSRAISNASNDALYNDYTPREALERAIETIDKELERKQDMYNIKKPVK